MQITFLRTQQKLKLVYALSILLLSGHTTGEADQLLVLFAAFIIPFSKIFSFFTYLWRSASRY
jgi:hypothetical protein